MSQQVEFKQKQYAESLQGKADRPAARRVRQAIESKLHGVAVGLTMSISSPRITISLARRGMKLEDRITRLAHVHGWRKIHHKIWRTGHALQSLPADFRAARSITHLFEVVAQGSEMVAGTSSQNADGVNTQPTGFWSRLEHQIEEFDSYLDRIIDSDPQFLGPSINMLTTKSACLSEEHTDWDTKTIQRLTLRALLTMMEVGKIAWKNFWSGGIIHEFSDIEKEAILGAIVTPVDAEATDQGTDTNNDTVSAQIQSFMVVL